MERLKGKVAIITGGGRGLGAETARFFAAEGAAVAVIDRDQETAEAVAAELSSKGSRAIAVTCDVRHRAEVDAAIAATADAFGSIDILVQYAQIIVIEVPFVELTEQQFDDSWRSGCLGSVFFMQGCLPYLKKNGGRIVNAASGAAFKYPPGHGAYSMAKQAILAVTATAAKEFGQYGVTVNAIIPIAQTPAMDAWQIDYPDLYQGMVNHIPMRRLGDTRDVANGVLSIVSDFSYSTGMTFYLDGGSSI